MNWGWTTGSKGGRFVGTVGTDEGGLLGSSWREDGETRGLTVIHFCDSHCLLGQDIGYKIVWSYIL